MPVNGLGGGALHKKANEFVRPDSVRPVGTETALVERSGLAGEMSAGGWCAALQVGGKREH